MILLLFFVMYMAFMIVCAQSSGANEGNSLQNSMNNSYISNDSAIAGCGKHKWQYSRIGSRRLSQQQQDDLEQQHQQAVYGQFYFDNTINGITTYSVPANECTPLFAGKPARAPEVALHHREGAKRFESSPMFSSQPNLDSCSIDCGLAVKNSACLIKSKNHANLMDEQDENNFDHESSWLHSNWVLLPMFPLTLSLKILTPLKFKNTCWTIWTFIVSIGLIGALTYVSVWMVHLFGQAMGLPETVAGMTILSWGTGIPELIASIVLIKKTAQADMAICNTIGSNVIDASFCLSLPWMVKCIMNKAAGHQPEVEVQSSALPWTSFTLFLSVVILLLVLKFHNWELSCSVGVWLLLTYCTFVGVATYLESTYSKSGLDLLSII